MSYNVRQYVKAMKFHYSEFDNIPWTSRDGETILLGKMSQSHLQNVINHQNRKLKYLSNQLETIQNQLAYMDKNDIKETHAGFDISNIQDIQEQIDMTKAMIDILQKVSKRRLSKFSKRDQRMLVKARSSLTSRS